MKKALVFWFLIASSAASTAADLSSPVKLSTLTPWPAITRLINYQNKLWFVHSNPYQDTNVANIYSHDPQTGETRFERSLFSQDAGKPVIHNDLLHWPFEDPRRSASSGEYAVTNGTDWQWRVMQSGHAMHVHALTSCNSQLIAVTGSWTGQYLTQQTNATWTLEHDYPKGNAGFSRLVDALEYKGECFVGASSNNDPKIKLLRAQGNELIPVDGWPISDRVDGLTVHDNKLYAWTDSGEGRILRSYDGTDVTTIEIDDGHLIRESYSHRDGLYVISSKGTDGKLWLVDVENKLQTVQTLSFIPVSLTADKAGHLYIGSFDRGGATLWKLDNNNPVEHSTVELEAEIIKATDNRIQKAEISNYYEALRSIVTDTSNGADNARALRAALARPEHLTKPAFGNVLTRLLAVQLPDSTIEMFTGRQIVWRDLVHWYLLTGLAINGNGTIDTALLSQPWTSKQSRSNKFFDPTVAAIVATGWIKQSDQKTINTLINRLNKPENDPDWLKSDIAGALTAITGQRFGTDGSAWSQWANTSAGQ